MPKISLIGIGKVGSTIAYSILLKGLASEMVLVDCNHDVADGDALDLLHASTFAHPMQIRSGDYSDAKDSDIVIICASIPSKDIKSRLDLCHGNTNLFKEIIPKITQASPNAILIVITNPIDIMVFTALKISRFPASRVIGTGTMVDSGRFRALLAAKTKVNPTDIHAYIIGEHGESQLPVLSRADMRSISIQERSTAETAKIFEQTRWGGDMVIQKKGFTNYAIALATATLVECIIYDKHKIYPVSTFVNDYYGMQDLCISVPAIIGRKGVDRILHIELNEDEQKAFQHSAKIIKDIISSLQF